MCMTCCWGTRVWLAAEGSADVSTAGGRQARGETLGVTAQKPICRGSPNGTLLGSDTGGTNAAVGTLTQAATTDTCPFHLMPTVGRDTRNWNSRLKT